MNSSFLPDRIQKALVDPRMAMEVRLWLSPQPANRHGPDHPLRDPVQRREITRQRQEAMLNWRGAVYAETGLHWAALADRGLMVDMVGLGLSPNAQDNTSRTPLDWLTDRAWMVLVEGKGHTDQMGKDKLTIASEDLIATLWGLGGRTGGTSLDQGGRLPLGYVWTRAGLWGIISLLKSNGLEGLRHWTVEGAGFLHTWPLGPEGERKDQALEDALEWGLDIDEPDTQGRTPLWYAIDAATARPQWTDRLSAAVAALVAHGADPSRPDQTGISPEMLLAMRPQENERKLSEALAGFIVT